MKKYIICLLLLFLASEASAYWIWTPKTKKWVNPKYSSKENPKEQLKYALSFYNSKQYDKAIAEFNRLIQYFPLSTQAADAQFYIAQSQESLSKYHEAYLSYQKVIDKYPFFTKVNDIVEKEFNIAERFLEGEKRKLLGINIEPLLENPCVEIYRSVISNAPYGKYAAIAQYKIGLFLKNNGDFEAAKEEFEKLISSYPKSEWVEAARYQIALCGASGSLSADYDQNLTKEAIKEFEDFLKKHPDAELSEDAMIKTGELREKEAESNFKIAQFYEKQKAYDSAVVYYKYVIENFPQSGYAAKSLGQIKIIESKKK